MQPVNLLMLKLLAPVLYYLVMSGHIYMWATNPAVRFVVFACIFIFNIAVVIYLWKKLFGGK